MGEAKTAINFIGLEKLLSPDALGEALVVEIGDRIIGLVGVLFEYSDWRDKLLYYLYDIRVNADISEDELQSITALIVDKVSNNLSKRNAACIRFAFSSEYVWMKEMIKNIGFSEPHYLIYEQIL